MRGVMTVKHPDELVARIKAAVSLGVPVKVIARFTNVSPATIADYSCGRSRSRVEPDPMMGESLFALFRGET